MFRHLYTVQQIRKKLRERFQRDVSLSAIHYVAQKLGFQFMRIGMKRGYDISAYYELAQHFNELVEYDVNKSVKPRQTAQKQPSLGDYYTYNGEKDNVDYEWEKKLGEGRIRKAIIESIEELDLYHGSPHEFQEFDLAFLSSGWGQQAYGYGVYLIDSFEGAKEYSKGGYVYMAKVPDGRYLSYKGISRREANKIARDLYRYYLNETEYGREAYQGHEKEFWDYECGVICDCETGGDVYGTIASILGDDKETSEFLYKEGYKGIKWFDKDNGTTNYVVFNPKDITILKKEKI